MKQETKYDIGNDAEYAARWLCLLERLYKLDTLIDTDKPVDEMLGTDKAHDALVKYIDKRLPSMRKQLNSGDVE